MKKIQLLFLTVLHTAIGFSQTEKDSIQTEIIHVITSFNPHISEAYKIKDKPAIHSTTFLKKNVSYKIAPSPINSAFEPNIGSYKSVKLPPKTRSFPNYIKAGYGSYGTPMIEGFATHKKREHQYQYTLFNRSSEGGIPDVELDNNNLKTAIGFTYINTKGNFDWEATTNYQKTLQNWYGSAVNLDRSVHTDLQEKQVYNLFSIGGKLNFQKKHLKKTSASLQTFSDKFDSKETEFNAAASFEFPLLKETLQSQFELNFLNGEFKKEYETDSAINYDFFGISAQASVPFQKDNFYLSIGAKINYISDLENRQNKVHFYPDLRIDFTVLEEVLNAYAGVTGGLQQNSYRELAVKNPFVSPTLTIQPSNNSSSFFTGVKGNLSADIHYDLKAVLRQENDKAFFRQNKSLTDGTGTLENGYEAGNSFYVIYDQMRTFGLEGSIAAALSEKWISGASFSFRSYTLDKEEKAWNLPAFESKLHATYKQDKWSGSSHLKIVGKRYDYDLLSDANITLKAYADLSANVNYDFDTKWTAFVEINNLLNNNYERFANFNVQGFQLLAGVIYKFDL
jgi:hypothetical protein